MEPSNNLLPLQFTLQSFRLLYKVTCEPDSLTAGQPEYAIVNESFCEVILRKVEDHFFPLATRLFQLAIAALICFLLMNALAYGLLLLTARGDMEWAVRNLFMGSITIFGLSSVLLICINMAASLYALIAGSGVFLLVFLLASIGISDQRAMSYAAGGFAIGCCLAFYAGWYRRHGQTIAGKSGSRISLGMAIGNIVYLFLLLLGYALLFYKISQRWSGFDYPYLFLGIASAPAIAANLISFTPSPPGREISRKDAWSLCLPVISFMLSSFLVYRFLCDSYFPGIKKYSDVPNAHWITGIGLGILIGVIVGNYFIFIRLVVGWIARTQVKKKFEEDLIVFVTVIVIWASCLLSGAFAHLEKGDTKYSFVGLIAGIGVAYLFSAIRSRRKRQQTP
jgi:MFS family permease